MCKQLYQFREKAHTVPQYDVIFPHFTELSAKETIISVKMLTLNKFLNRQRRVNVRSMKLVN